MNVVARLPSPLAGPSYLVTASEVATLQFAREVLNLPVPRVITWSGAKRGLTKAVGADFIIMEEVPGVRLSHRWEEFDSADDVRPIMTGVLDVETKFESLSFSRIGSLYFKEDVSADLQTIPLLTGSIDATTRQLSEKYRVGPLINYQWWRGERAHMPLDRGPCMYCFPAQRHIVRSLKFCHLGPDASSFFIAAAKNEQMVLQHHSSKSFRYRRKPTHDHASHSKLLSMYIDAVPHFMPSDSNLCAPTLWHPDLSLNNLFVSASGPANLQGMIDWQHAAILPYFSFQSLPPAFVYNGNKINMDEPLPGPLPSNIDELSAKEQAEYRLQHRLAYRHRWYQAKIGLNPRREAALRLPHIQELMMLPTYVTRAWVDGVSDLRESLVSLCKNWATITDPNTPCPIKFSEEEMKEHERQLEQFRCYEAAIAAVYSALHCEGDGWVAHEDYDVVQKLIGELEESWDESISGSPFPFKDGEHSYFLS